MTAAWLQAVLAQLTAVVASHAPAGWSRWAFAGAITAGGFLLAAVGGRIIARLVQAAIIMAAVLVGWRLVTG